MILGKTAKHYRKNAASYAKKKAKDVARMTSPAGLKKRAELKRKCNAAKKAGKDIEGKDYDHGSKKFISAAKNRGKRSGTRGDSNARG
tara:strand:- start:3766 stop:4029 length:264 start_codon:yes stop_codon:yes gene_type:complete